MENKEYYTEKYTLSLSSTFMDENFQVRSAPERTLNMSFETESLSTVLDKMLTFLNASGFTYVKKLKAYSKDGTKDWETKE